MVRFPTLSGQNSTLPSFAASPQGPKPGSFPDFFASAWTPRKTAAWACATGHRGVCGAFLDVPGPLGENSNIRFRSPVRCPRGMFRALLPGDLNGDRAVDDADFVSFALTLWTGDAPQMPLKLPADFHLDGWWTTRLCDLRPGLRRLTVPVGVYVSKTVAAGPFVGGTGSAPPPHPWRKILVFPDCREGFRRRDPTQLRVNPEPNAPRARSPDFPSPDYAAGFPAGATFL